MKSFVFKLSVVILFLSLTTLVFAQKDFSKKFRTIRVPAGKIITIPLESIPSTGFSWQLVKISDKMVLEFVKKEYVANLNELVGSEGIENWSFKTLKKGKVVIVFKYRRLWEKDSPNQKKDEFNIFVE